MTLILLAVFGWTRARPHHEENQPMMMRFCGNDLALVIDEVCTGHKSPADLIDPLILNEQSIGKLLQ